LQEVQAAANVSLLHLSTGMVYIRQKKQSGLKQFSIRISGYFYLCAACFFLLAVWLGLIK
jgi:hypothetical protein